MAAIYALSPAADRPGAILRKLRASAGGCALWSEAPDGDSILPTGALQL